MTKKIPNPYQKALFEKYHAIKKDFLEGLLDGKLTQKNIQDALLIRKDSLSNGDNKILSNFCELEGFNSIEIVPITKYKPLINFLTKESPKSIRNQETVNLLAFLLDFKPRPYSQFLKEGKHEITEISTEKQSNLIVQSFKDKYLNHSDFNSIKINGDVDNSIGLLSMENYYIQLSYISQADIYNRNSLLKSEIDPSYFKIKASRVPLSITAHSQDYITEAVLVNDRIVISGNPGVGKSTYAKWLCYYWANHCKEESKILIYVKLRDLQFENKDFLFEFIQNEYRNKFLPNIKNLQELLDALGNYQLILDGFDEIDTTNRVVLTQKIKNLNYVVLSRPYGLINHQLNYDVSFQIDGFNAESLTHYLSVVIENNKHTDKSKDELKSLITKNRILHDFSHNPLMLSYIVLIYLTSDTYKTDLSGIESIYDLQAKVFDWSLHYAKQKHKINVTFSYSMRKKIQAFAFELQINKKFTYIYNANDKHFKTITNLYAIGLGSFTKLGKHEYNKWQFSFNTITFQEFLAAQHLENKPFNKEAFTYLITDSFFWNYAVMLVGMLSKNSKTSKLLTEVLDFLYTFSKKETASYYRYSYYLLLAECNSNVVSDEVTKRSIADSINYYKKVYFDNFWESVMLDSLVKIVYKLPYKLKNEYINCLLDEMRYNSSFEVEKSYYLSNLMDIGIEYNEEDILFALKELLEFLLKDLNEIEKKTLKIENEKHNEGTKDYNNWMERMDEKYEKENAIRIAITNLYNDFSLFSPDALTKIGDFVLKVYREEATFIRALEYIIAKVKWEEYNLEHFKTYYSSLKNTEIATISTQKQSKQIHVFENALLLAENIFISLNSTDTYYQFDRQLVYDASKYLADNIHAFISLDSINDFYITHFVDLCISNLILLNKPNLYTTISSLVYKYEINILTKIPNKDSFYTFIVSMIEKAVAEKDLQTIEKGLFFIKQTVFRAFDFYRYRAWLLKIFKVLQSQKEQDYNTKATIEVIDHLLIQIANIPFNNFDKKFFINELTKDTSTLIPFIKKDIILRRLANNFMFYEKQYWQSFSLFLKEFNWDIRSVVRLLSNKDLYLFKTNHAHLFTIFIQTFENKENKNEKIYAEFGSDILFIITQMLLIIKKKPNNALKQKLIQQIEEIIKHPKILNYYQYRITDLTAIEQVTAYILFYALNPSKETLFFKENLYQEVSNEVGAKMAIIDYILVYMENPNYGIEIHEVEKLKPILGKAFYNDLIVVIEQRLLNKNQFDSNYFSMLLEA